MTKATERLFDKDGALLASAGDEVSAGVQTFTAAELAPAADAAYPAGHPRDAGPDPVDSARTEPSPPATQTPMEQFMDAQGIPGAARP